MATKMVMAIGDSGKPELTPENETVTIQVLPLGPGNSSIPATLEFFGDRPIKLTGIRKPTETCPFPQLILRTAEGKRCDCILRGIDDAQHRVFESLPMRSRARILAEMGAQS